MTVVVDYLREEELEKGKEAPELEVGLHYEISTKVETALGLAMGLNKEAPHWGGLAGVEFLF